MNSIVFRSVLILLVFGMVALGSSLSIISSAQRSLRVATASPIQKVSYQPTGAASARVWGECALDANKSPEVRALCTREIRRHYDQLDPSEKSRFSRIPSHIIRLSRDLD